MIVYDSLQLFEVVKRGKGTTKIQHVQIKCTFFIKIWVFFNYSSKKRQILN